MKQYKNDEDREQQAPLSSARTTEHNRQHRSSTTGEIGQHQDEAQQATLSAAGTDKGNCAPQAR